MFIFILKLNYFLLKLLKNIFIYFYLNFTAACQTNASNKNNKGIIGKILTFYIVFYFRHNILY